MPRKTVRHSHVKPVVNVVLSVEERSKFAAFFEILVAVDKRVKKVKKKAKSEIWIGRFHRRSCVYQSML